MPNARDPHRPSAHFLQFIADCDEDRNWHWDRLTREDRDRAAWLRARNGFAMDSRDQAMAAYSAGLPISDVRARAVRAIGELGAFYALGLEDEAAFLDPANGNGAIGIDALYTYLGWAVVFDLDAGTTAPIASCIAAMRRAGRLGEDRLVDRFLDYLGLLEGDLSGDLNFPEAYAALEACFTLQPELRPVQLSAFVEGWYKACKARSFAWYGRHRNDPQNRYPGYWRFEAVAVAKILGIDDAALAGNPFYPYAVIPR